MRRREKEITDYHEIEDILSKAEIMHVGLSDKGIPYVVPLCFGYHDRKIYFHGSPGGKKSGIIEHHNVASFSCVSYFKIHEEADPCSWSMEYRSAIGFGRVRVIYSAEEKQAALACIMKHYGYRGEMNFPQADRTEVVCLHVEELTGKKSLL